jgi:hypothetical protein
MSAQVSRRCPQRSPGRFILCTSPSSTGSPPSKKTIGMVAPSIMCRPRRAKDALRNRLAPKRAGQRAGTERHPVESDRDPLRSPYTPKQARAQPVTSRFVAGDDAEQPAAARRDQIMSDHDLERLEASLRQLQRQESATRLRASNLAAVSGLAPVHASGRRHSGERFGDGFRSPRSLEPARLPPPPAMSHRNIGTPVGIVVASILVATVAYYFAVAGWVPSSEPAPGPQTTSSDPTGQRDAIFGSTIAGASETLIARAFTPRSSWPWRRT